MSHKNIFDINLAGRQDLPAIESINKHCEDKEYSHVDSFFEQGIDGHRVFVAYKDGKPAGYLIWQLLWGNTPFLALLRIIPECRGEGLGSELVEMLCYELKEVGFKALISSSEAVNEGGKKFHEKMGFEQIGELDMIFGKEVFYKRTLD